jgi:murein DD-endopeptidase MepM/ murein hydrolase activator NlpD
MVDDAGTMNLIRRALVLTLTAIAALAVAAAPASAAPTPPRITFPVEGTVTFVDSFGAPRSGGRTHAGQDIMAPKMRRALAAADGVVSALRHDNTGLSGNSLTITGDDGWKYIYIHLNNDTPGTDDGANRYDQAFATGITKGVRVKAGQHVAYVGDSGNAEDTAPHLHFEMHAPDGTVINPYISLMNADRTVVK